MIPGLFLAVLTVGACSRPEPRVGAAISTVEAGEGVSLTQAESRYLLPDGKIAGDEGEILSIKAKVAKVDHARRMVALLNPSGETLELVVGEEVRNFAQVKAGDTVNVQYLVSMAFEVRNPTAEEVAIAGSRLNAAARAQPGQLPAAGAASRTIKIGKIDSIDKKSSTVTLSGLSESGPTIFKAKYPENLNYAKAGDSVVVTMIQAIATSVTRVE